MGKDAASNVARRRRRWDIISSSSSPHSSPFLTGSWSLKTLGIINTPGKWIYDTQHLTLRTGVDWEIFLTLNPQNSWLWFLIKYARLPMTRVLLKKNKNRGKEMQQVNVVLEYLNSWTGGWWYMNIKWTKINPQNLQHPHLLNILDNTFLFIQLYTHAYIAKWMSWL